MGKFWFAAIVAVLAWGFAMHTMASADESKAASEMDAMSATAAATYNLGATAADGL